MNIILKNYIFLYFFILLLVLSYQLVQNISNTFALSSSSTTSSFERQEVSNMQNNGWMFWHLNNKEQNIPSKDG